MATVSEYLNILVGFDVPKLKAEAGKVNKELSDVDKKANNLMKSFGNAKKMALGFFAALAGTSSIAAFVANVTAADAALGRLSKTTGMSVEAISAWSNAAERAGGSAAEMQSGIANMSKELTNFKYTGESTLVPFLAQMGVSIVDVNGKLKDQNQIMLELADRAQSMPKEDFANLAMANGFNQSQVNLMLQGRKALQQQISEQNRNAITTKQQAEAAQQLETAWVDAKQAFMGVARTVAYVLVPPLTLLLKGVAAIFTFIGNHKIILVALFAFLVPKLLMTVKLFLTLGRAIGLLSPALRVATLAMRGFGLSSAIALAPLILIGTALALLFDDFMTFQAGGDSFIPWDKIFGGAKDAMESIKDLVSSLGLLKDLLSAITTGDWASAKKIGGEIIDHLTPTALVKKMKEKNQPAPASSNSPSIDVSNMASGSWNTVNSKPSTGTGWKIDFGTGATALHDNMTYKMGAKNINGATIDCSGWVDALNRETCKQISKQFGEQAAKASRVSAGGGAAGILQDQFKRGHGIAKAGGMQDLDLNKLQAGMIIGQARGKHAIGRYGNIGHIIAIVEENGQKYVSESTSAKGADGKSGVQKTLLTDYIKKLKGRRFGVYVADPYKDIRSQLGGATNAAKKQVNNATTSASNVLFGTNAPSGTNGNYFKYDDIIQEMSKKYGVPANLIKGIMHQESHFNPNARSPVGAQGLMQLMPATAKRWGVKNPFDVRQNIEGGTRNLKMLMNMFGNDYDKIIGGYNAGEGNAKTGKMWRFGETRKYIPKVRGYMTQARFANGGFLAAGARGQAALSSGGSVNSNNVHSETHIGNINIHTVATDAVGIAKAIPGEIKNQYSRLAHAVSSGMS